MSIVSPVTPSLDAPFVMPPQPEAICSNLLDLHSEISESLADMCCLVRQYSTSVPAIVDLQTLLLVRLAHCISLLRFPLAPEVAAIIATEAAEQDQYAIVEKQIWTALKKQDCAA